MTQTDCGLHNELMYKGQALVVVLLILAVIATMGLSVISRSVTEVSQSTVQEESARALEAAEVALEKYLGKTNPTPYQVYDLGNSTQYSINEPAPLNGGDYYVIPGGMRSGDVVTIDYSGHSGGQNQLEVCWGDPSATYGTASTAPVMMVTVYYHDGVWGFAYKTATYDPLTPTDLANNRFKGWRRVMGGSSCATIDPTINYKYNRPINFGNNTGGLHLNSGTVDVVRLRLLGAWPVNTVIPVAVNPSGTMGVQAVVVESTGVAGESVQRIRAQVPEPDAPGMFDAAIYSGTGIIKSP